MIHPAQLLTHPTNIRVGQIDPKKSKRSGRISRFFKYNRIPLNGLTLNALGFDGNLVHGPVAEVRTYELEEDGRVFFVFGDPFFQRDIDCPELHLFLVLARLVLAFDQGLLPTQILWPAGFYGDAWIARAGDFWFRRLTDAELETMPALFRRMTRLHGPLFCFDGTRLKEVQNKAAAFMAEARWREIIDDCLYIRVSSFITGYDPAPHAARREFPPFI